jgi:tetratricopeptide (TPR) repeat protein
MSGPTSTGSPGSVPTAAAQSTVHSTALLDLLQALPSQTDRQYAPSARGILEQPGASVDALQAIAEDTAVSKDLRFNAFYCMQAREWRLRNYTRHRANTDRFQSEFGDQPMLDFMQAEYYSVADHEISNLETALIFAKQARDRLPSVPGILHLYAELVCKYVERSGVKDQALLAEADRAIARAIALDPAYPKYFATRAVVSLLRGAFDDALQQVSVAIDREDSDGPHYALRIGDYQLIRSRIAYAIEYAQMRRSQDDAITEFRQMRSQVLATLGLLAAVVALIASATNIASGNAPKNAEPLFLVCGGVILIVFWGFHFLFVGSRRGFSGIVPLIVGLMLVSIGFVWSILI